MFVYDVLKSPKFLSTLARAIAQFNLLTTWATLVIKIQSLARISERYNKLF